MIPGYPAPGMLAALALARWYRHADMRHSPWLLSTHHSWSEGTQERHKNRANMSRDHREAVCAQTASRSPDSTFWGASRLFLRCIGPRRPICIRILRCTSTGCAVGEFKIGRSGGRRSCALGPDRLGHTRAFRLGTRAKFKPRVLWLTNLEARPHNSIFQSPSLAPRQPSAGRGHPAKRR